MHVCHALCSGRARPGAVVQELARVMPPAECAAMLERFISGLDAPGVQSQLLYVVLKRMQAAVEPVAGKAVDADPKPAAKDADRMHAPPPDSQGSLWDSQQMGDVVLAPLLRIIKLTKSKRHGILETRGAMAPPQAQHVVQQSEVLVAVINILIFQVLRGRHGRLGEGFANCVQAWLTKHNLPPAGGVGSLVQCVIERVAAAKAALEASGKDEEALGMELIVCAASRLQETLTSS